MDQTCTVFRHQHEKSLIKTLSHTSFGSSTGLNHSNSHVNSDDKKKENAGSDKKSSSDEKEKAKLEIVKVDVDNNMVSVVCHKRSVFH